MSSVIEAKLKSSLADLNSLIKSAKQQNIDFPKLISTLKLPDSQDDTIIQILDQLKQVSSDQGSSVISASTSSSLISSKKSEKLNEKQDLTNSHLKRIIKTLQKIQKNNSKLSSEISSSDCPVNTKNALKSNQVYLEKTEQKFMLLFNESNSDKNQSDSSTLPHPPYIEQIKLLESNINTLKSKLKHVLKVCGLSCENKNSHNFSYPEFFKIFDNIQESFRLLSGRLEKLKNKIKALSNSEFFQVWKKYKNLINNYDINSAYPECRSLVLILNELLKMSRPETLNLSLEIKIPDPTTTTNSLSHEALLISNTELKSLALKYEGEVSKIRSLEDEIFSLKEKNEFLEKVNKEITNKKTEGSSDSLNLDISNIKDLIEIQELRSALAGLSEKYEQDKETLIKDIIESRQDMETQIFRLQNEKNYIQVKQNDTERRLDEIVIEKERLESILQSIKKENERLKESKTSESRFLGSRRTSEYQGSQDFELTGSISNFAINSDLYDLMQEELNEIALKLIENEVVVKEESPIQTIRKSANMLVSIKKYLDYYFEVSKFDLFSEIKSFISSLNLKISSLNKKLEESECVIFEKDFKINELLKYETDSRTESSPRKSKFEVLKEQLENEKAKIKKKKSKISLHKEQISALKKNIRDLNFEVERCSKIDVVMIREIWVRVCRDIPILGKSTEESLDVFMRKLGFSGRDYMNLANERKVRKGKFSLTI